MRRVANLRRMLAGVEGRPQASVFNAPFGYPAPEAPSRYACAPRQLANLSGSMTDTFPFKELAGLEKTG